MWAVKKWILLGIGIRDLLVAGVAVKRVALKLDQI